MKENGKAARTREHIVKTAVEYINEHGAIFSLEEIARHAGVSKGGLLYNFPSKVALIRAIVAHFVADLEATVAEAEARLSQDPYPNKLMRALLVGLSEKCQENEGPHSGMLAAIVDDPDMLDPVRDFHSRVYNRIMAESEHPELARFAYMAVEGIRAQQIFQILPVAEGETVHMLQWMDRALKSGDWPGLKEDTDLTL
ncbi:TetR/AcrR family transcriptional regulator [Polycladidibacter hongkongensis]|uniref:TetR/AcrR family transcriptional regulator n=1 Tax=Polycladidibacter hongkongensis TaxID=1647556 RepID=UPI0009EBCC02|nr:TetR/AcrR family transcriptional regulator [Pseudovibrio hongkongensis]